MTAGRLCASSRPLCASRAASANREEGRGVPGPHEPRAPPRGDTLRRPAVPGEPAARSWTVCLALSEPTWHREFPHRNQTGGPAASSG